MGLFLKIIIILFPFLSFAQCLKNPTVYFSPLKEIYRPNDTISVTFEFLYERKGLNWLSAVEIQYSDSWDISYPFLVPNNCRFLNGHWAWDKKDTIQGFFFTDYRATQDYGDDCLCLGCDPFTDFFLFSWKMVVNDCSNPHNLVLLINTYSDSEFGTWRISDCQNDPIYRVIKLKDCLSSCNKFGSLKN